MFRDCFHPELVRFLPLLLLVLLGNSTSRDVGLQIVPPESLPVEGRDYRKVPAQRSHVTGIA